MHRRHTEARRFSGTMNESQYGMKKRWWFMCLLELMLHSGRACG